MLSSRLQSVVFEGRGNQNRLRVWPCFVVVPVAILLYTLFTGVYHQFAFKGFYYSDDPAWEYGGWKLLLAHAGTITALCVGALIAAYIPARLSQSPVKDRLLLTRPGIGLLRIVAIAIGSIFVGTVSSYLLWMANMTLPEFIWSSNPGWNPYGYDNNIAGVIVLAFVTGIAPGIAEELLFRGYIQSRLLRRWPAPVAIGVTSVLFGIYHMNTEQFFTSTLMGLWLGVLAWRTGSVLPSIAAHFTINVFASLSQWAEYDHEWIEADFRAIGIIVGIISIGFFYLAVRSLWTYKGVQWRAETE